MPAGSTVCWPNRVTELVLDEFGLRCRLGDVYRGTGALRALGPQP